MKLNYIDLGVMRCEELDWMLKDVTPKLDMDCRFYGLDACKKYCDIARSRIIDHRVNIYHKAISNKDGMIKLYYAHNEVGHSTYPTKNNVDKNNFESVEAVKFSDFVEENIPTFKDDFNIVKINIEGAEWDFFNNIIDTGLIDNIDIICGQGHDVEKVSELNAKDYFKMINDNNIVIHRYSEFKPERNIDMLKMIKEKLKNRRIK
tara:strand:+ start:140 stop:754 length:615 start_codon:yes stop_codon:yes gene_type:complete